MHKTSFRLILLVIITGVIISCKKEKQAAAPPPPPVVTPPPPVSADVIKDSALIYSKDIYLWNTQIPATFNAKDYSDPDKVMEALRQFSMEPGFTQPVDRFSFAMKKVDWDNMSAGFNSVFSSTTADGDFGITVFFKVEGDLRVRLTEPNSPAGAAGIKRGWRITKINGNTNITTGNSTFIVDNIYDAATVNITFKKPDGSSVDISLNRDKYKEKPVYLDTVYNINNKKIGYLVFNSFLGKVTEITSEFQRVFTNFAGAGVNDIIIDLRYNGGGYVSLQEKLANYLVNATSNGSVMMKQVYNANNSASNHTTNFTKEGSINLTRIYFIVGRASASASELLINNLKPYLDVKLIGGTTYGKPVGFFPIPVGEWYIFPVSFRTTNKNGEGNYFNGIAPTSNVADGLDKDWGDITETSLASAIRHITTGTFRIPAEQPYIEPMNVASGNKTLESPFLKVTIGDVKPL